MSERRITRVTLTDRRGGLKKPLTAAICADLHDAPFADVLPALAGVDCILVPGDLVNRHHSAQPNALRFLRAAPDIAPVFVSIGNHEVRAKGSQNWLEVMRKSGVTLVDDTALPLREDVAIGGLSSAWRDTPRTDAVSALEAFSGYRLLLCHHPEHFEPHVRDHEIDLTIAGHAHGGQIQLFGRGLYAPGQGLLPRLTHGLYFQDRLLVSRGMTNSASPPAPRWGNPCEVILLTVLPR